MEFQNEAIRCKVCNRKLTNPKYREIGMGPTCYKKVKNKPIHKQLFSCPGDPVTDVVPSAEEAP